MTFMDLSSEPVSKHSPFGLKATVLTVLLCALMMLLLPSLQINSNIFVWDSENYVNKKGFVFKVNSNIKMSALL